MAGWDKVRHEIMAANLIVARTTERSTVLQQKMHSMAASMGRHFLIYTPQSGLRWWNPRGGQKKTGGWHQTFPPGTPIGEVLNYLAGGEGGFNAPFLLHWEYPHQEWGGDGEEALVTFLEMIDGEAKTLVGIVSPEDQLPPSVTMGGNGSAPDVPSRVKAYATILSLPKPDADELLDLVMDMVEQNDELASVYQANPFTFEETHAPNLVRAMRGLTISEARRCIRAAYNMLPDDPVGTFDGTPEYWHAWLENIAAWRSGQVEQRGRVRLLDTKNPPKVSGYDEFMADVQRLIRKGAFQFKYENGNVRPSPAFEPGFALVGLPGTAKTDIVRWLGNVTGLPVYEMMTRARGNGVVNAAANTMRATLEEVMANGPAILFIDEFDKLVDGEGGMDSGEKAGLVGELLKAMAGELKRAGVMVFLAMNKPPKNSAMLRAGRVNRKYFVDVQRDPAVRAQTCLTLIQRQLSEQNAWRLEEKLPAAEVQDGALETLVQVTDGFVGAEIEALVQQAFNLYEGGNRLVLTIANIRRARSRITPMSEDPAMIPDIRQIRALGGEYLDVSGAAKAAPQAPRPQQRPPTPAPAPAQVNPAARGRPDLANLSKEQKLALARQLLAKQKQQGGS